MASVLQIFSGNERESSGSRMRVWMALCYAVRKGAAEVRGIDSSRRMIEEAQKRNSDNRIQYQVCGAEDYSYPANEYDIVLSNLVLHYIQDLNGIIRRYTIR